MMLVIGTCDGDVDVVPPIDSQLEDATLTSPATTLV